MSDKSREWYDEHVMLYGAGLSGYYMYDDKRVNVVELLELFAAAEVARETKELRAQLQVEQDNCGKLEAKLKAAAAENAELAKQYERDMVIKDCSQCHGSVNIIDSESGGFPAKCHCWQVRCNELRKRAEAAESREAKLRRELLKVEYDQSLDGENWCSECDYKQGQGHSPICEKGAALAPESKPGEYRSIQRRSSEKCEKVKPYLHHQQETTTAL